MSQTIWTTIDPDTTSGNQLATHLNALKDAIVSGFTGTSRPVNLQAGGYWIDTTNAGSPNFYWDLNVWTGTVDVRLFRISLSNGTVSLTGSDNTFAVTRITADAVGPLMQLIKRRIATNGQVLDGDVVGEVQFIGRASDSSNPVVAKIIAVASDNMTASASGTYLAFHSTEDTTAAMTEVMRIMDKKLGVGTVTPSTTLHVVGTGITNQKTTDDAIGAKDIFKKKRITGVGQVQNNDVIGQDDYVSTDDAGADLTVARVEVKATQLHTSTAGGTQWKLAVAKTGSVALTDKITIADSTTTMKEAVSIEAPIIEQQDVATTATIAALSASKGIVKFTGSTATELQGISSTGNAKVLTLHNASTAVITVRHASGSASAADRFNLPNALDILVTAGTTLEVFYSTTESRWKIKSGSGSGSGGGYNIDSSSTETISGGGTITTSTIFSRQVKLVKAASGGNDTSTTPFGTGGGWADGTEITLVGTDETAPLSISYNDANYGAVGNFSSITLGNKYSVARFIWLNSALRWVYDGGT